MSLQTLFEEGLLKKCVPSEEKAKKSIQTSENYLKKAKKVFDHRMDDVAILLAYSSAFHASRAILFNEGVAERSHYAVAEYLKFKHKELGDEILQSFNVYRKLRHSISYGLDTEVNEKDSFAAIKFAEEILKKVKKILKK